VVAGEELLVASCGGIAEVEFAAAGVESSGGGAGLWARTARRETARMGVAWASPGPWRWERPMRMPVKLPGPFSQRWCNFGDGRVVGGEEFADGGEELGGVCFAGKLNLHYCRELRTLDTAQCDCSSGPTGIDAEDSCVSDIGDWVFADFKEDAAGAGGWTKK